MPKKKITLEEAFAVFEQHGLQVEVKGIAQDTPDVPLSDFLDDDIQYGDTQEGDIQDTKITKKKKQLYTMQQVSPKKVRVILHAAHTVGNGGVHVKNKDGTYTVENNGIETYGPGPCTVPSELASHLLHQDMLAKQADERFLDRTQRSYIIAPRDNGMGGKSNVAFQLPGNVDFSEVIGRLDGVNVYHI